MLGKLIITILVIAIAVVYLRQRPDPDPKQPAKDAEKPESASNMKLEARDLRTAAYLFLVIMIGTGAFLYYRRWQDDHILLTVTLYRDGDARPVSYRVYKYQLQTRTFVTTDGTRITVADNERMEVKNP